VLISFRSFSRPHWYFNRMFKCVP